jgi:hypothetical protein
VSWDQADLTDDYCARRKIARRQTFAGFQTGPAEGTVADAMSEPLRRTIVYEDAGDGDGDGDGWMVARIPQVRGAISQGATRRGGARKRDRRAPRAARGPVRRPSCQTALTANRSS